MSLFPDLESDRVGVPKFNAKAPLATRMRPQTVQDFFGQSQILVKGSPVERFLNPETADSSLVPPSLILWGPPGTGKTTLAYLIAKESNKRFLELSAVSDGIQEVKFAVNDAKGRQEDGRETILFIDEIHRFSKNQQDSLLPAVENKSVTLIMATTENPSFSIVAPLLSRSLMVTLQPLSEDNIRSIIKNALLDERGLNGKYTLTDEALEILARISSGDARKALTILEAAAGVSHSFKKNVIDKEGLELAAQQALVRWDNDQHYDVTSAFIKSMRGSDPHATLHYLARMIEAGEDPRFIARRIMIAASEDVGLADSSVLQTTVAAAQAVALIGFPEARIILSQAALSVANAPKSNSALVGIDKALEDVRMGITGPVPSHLRDAHYYGAKALGNGVKYKYPHSFAGGFVEQQYLPDELVGKEYYISKNPNEISMGNVGVIQGTVSENTVKSSSKSSEDFFIDDSPRNTPHSDDIF